MSQSKDFLGKAQAFLAKGKAKRAESLCRAQLKNKAAFVPTRVLLSKALVAQGKLKAAAAYLVEAAASQPENTALQKAAGEMAAKVGNHHEACEVLERAVAQSPNNPLLWSDLLNSMLVVYQTSDEKSPQGLNDLIILAGKATTFFPASIELMTTAGQIFFEARQFDAARACLEKCLPIEPLILAAHHRWLEIHHIEGDYKPIIPYADQFHERIATDPLCNRVIASAYEKNGMAQVAEQYLDKALSLRPDDPEYLGSKGRQFYFQGKFTEALDYLNRSIDIDPTLIAPRANRCLVNKNLGDIAEAAKDEPARLLVPDGNPKFHLDVPLWEGESLKGRKLFIWSDQGVGDVFKYAPMIHEIEHTEGHIILCTQAKLITFLEHVFPELDIRAFPRYSTPPLPDGEINISPVFNKIEEDFDCHIPIGYLYRHFRSDIASFSEKCKPFSLNDALVARYHHLDMLSNHATTKVGLAWSSKNKNPIVERNYLSLEDLLPILRMPGFEFYNFQYDVSEDEINAFRQRHDVPLYHAPGLDLFDDLLGTSAFNNCMDLFFSPACTSSDIAGSLGIKCLRADLIHLPENLGQTYVPWYKDQSSLSIPYDKTILDFMPKIMTWLDENKEHRNPINIMI